MCTAFQRLAPPPTFHCSSSELVQLSSPSAVLHPLYRWAKKVTEHQVGRAGHSHLGLLSLVPHLAPYPAATGPKDKNKPRSTTRGSGNCLLQTLHQLPYTRLWQLDVSGFLSQPLSTGATGELVSDTSLIFRPLLLPQLCNVYAL